MQWGGTAAIIGLLIVLLTYFFIDAVSVQIAGFAVGGVLALTEYIGPYWRNQLWQKTIKIKQNRINRKIRQ